MVIFVEKPPTGLSENDKDLTPSSFNVESRAKQLREEAAEQIKNPAIEQYLVKRYAAILETFKSTPKQTLLVELYIVEKEKKEQGLLTLLAVAQATTPAVGSNSTKLEPTSTKPNGEGADMSSTIFGKEGEGRSEEPKTQSQWKEGVVPDVLPSPRLRDALPIPAVPDIKRDKDRQGQVEGRRDFLKVLMMGGGAVVVALAIGLGSREAAVSFWNKLEPDQRRDLTDLWDKLKAKQISVGQFRQEATTVLRRTMPEAEATQIAATLEASATSGATSTPEMTATPAGLKLPEAPRTWSITSMENSLLMITERNKADVLKAFGLAYPDLLRQYGGDVEAFAKKAGVEIAAYNPLFKLFQTADGKFIVPTLGHGTADDAEYSLQELAAKNALVRSGIQSRNTRFLIIGPTEELRGGNKALGFDEEILAEQANQDKLINLIKEKINAAKPGAFKDDYTYIFEEVPLDLTDPSKYDHAEIRQQTGGGVRGFFANSSAYGSTDLKDARTMHIRFSMSDKDKQFDQDRPDGAAGRYEGAMLISLAVALGAINPSNYPEVWGDYLSNVSMELGTSTGRIESFMQLYND